MTGIIVIEERLELFTTSYLIISMLLMTARRPLRAQYLFLEVVMTTAVRKIRGLAELSTTNVHHILSLFNIVSCN